MLYSFKQRVFFLNWFIVVVVVVLIIETIERDEQVEKKIN